MLWCIFVSNSTDAWDTISPICREPSSPPSPSLFWQLGQPPHPSNTGRSILLIADWSGVHSAAVEQTFQSRWYTISLKCVQHRRCLPQGNETTGFQWAHTLGDWHQQSALSRTRMHTPGQIHFIDWTPQNGPLLVLTVLPLQNLTLHRLFRRPVQFPNSSCALKHCGGNDDPPLYQFDSTVIAGIHSNSVFF